MRTPPPNGANATTVTAWARRRRDGSRESDPVVPVPPPQLPRPRLGLPDNGGRAAGMATTQVGRPRPQTLINNRIRAPSPPPPTGGSRPPFDRLRAHRSTAQGAEASSRPLPPPRRRAGCHRTSAARPSGRRPVGLGDVEGVDGLAGQGADVGGPDGQPLGRGGAAEGAEQPARSPVRTSITAALALAPGTASTRAGPARCAGPGAPPACAPLRSIGSPASSRSSSCVRKAGSGRSPRLACRPARCSPPPPRRCAAPLTGPTPSAPSAGPPCRRTAPTGPGRRSPPAPRRAGTPRGPVASRPAGPSGPGPGRPGSLTGRSAAAVVDQQRPRPGRSAR